MARRRKSFTDIVAQRDRILGNLGLGPGANAPTATQQGYRYSYDRANRVIDRSSDYLRNIREKKSVASTRNEQGLIAYKGLRRKFARNTYMGNSNG